MVFCIIGIHRWRRLPVWISGTAYSRLACTRCGAVVHPRARIR